MKQIFTIYCVIAALFIAAFPAEAKKQSRSGKPAVAAFKWTRSGDIIDMTAEIVLDSMEMGRNHQLFVTPVLTGAHGEEVVFPSVLINGRNMHYAYERKSLAKDVMQRYPIFEEVWRKNGSHQAVAYRGSAKAKRWMFSDGASMRLEFDTCGCGRTIGKGFDSVPIDPPLRLPKLRVAFRTPEVTPPVIVSHEGKARVQFEVDRWELHDSVYRDKHGRIIDNRAELKTIEDSLIYALSNPHVEITNIDVTGYASPESPYTHNDMLATNRSKALRDYLAGKFQREYQIPADLTTYHRVPENWEEFEKQVIDAKDITDKQRADLLELIRAKADFPDEYDAKERILERDPRFAKLYKEKIRPEWFPYLRATKFSIKTQLKPLTDEELREVMEKNPELLTLNQMMRVARLYPEGGEEFNKAIAKALRQYPDDPTANLNAAVAFLQRDDFAEAAKYLEKAGMSPEAENARGVIAAERKDFNAALEHFKNAEILPEAARNKETLEFELSLFNDIDD